MKDRRRQTRAYADHPKRRLADLGLHDRPLTGALAHPYLQAANDIHPRILALPVAERLDGVIHEAAVVCATRGASFAGMVEFALLERFGLSGGPSRLEGTTRPARELQSLGKVVNG